jgi:hypothetical protein
LSNAVQANNTGGRPNSYLATDLIEICDKSLEMGLKYSNLVRTEIIKEFTK